ncbi:MAG: type II secretion system protein [Oscillospiraceae bacterium]|jgi:type II secretory pathway pseudopilin PulG
MKSNKGVSYIELLVAIVIIGIAVTLVSMSISAIFSLNARQCAKKTASLLSQCKVDAMSRTGDNYLMIFKNSDGIYARYYINDIPREDELIGKSSLNFSCTGTDGNSYSDEDIFISFDRTSGAFLPIKESAALAGVSLPALSDDVYYDGITVSSGGKAYTVRMVPSTGKFSVVVS